MSSLAIVTSLVAVLVTFLISRNKADQGDVSNFLRAELERVQDENRARQEQENAQVLAALQTRLETANGLIRATTQEDVSALRKKLDEVINWNEVLSVRNTNLEKNVANATKKIEECERDLTRAFNEKLYLFGQLVKLPREELDKVINITNIARDARVGRDLACGDVRKGAETNE